MIDVKAIMYERAKKKKRKVVMCEAFDERILKAADEIIKQDIAEIVLFGDEEVVKKKAEELKLDISKAEIVNPKTSEFIPEFTDHICELRKADNVTKEQAEEFIKDENYFACCYVDKGHAEAIAGSVVCSTAELMRPVLRTLSSKDTIPSEVGLFEDVKNSRIFFMTDISLNISPTAEERADIAINAANVARSFGLTPKVAMLSFSTKGSADKPILYPIRESAEIARKKDPELIVDAEYQFDAAVNETSAKRKCPGAIIQGDANVIVFPDLNAGNIFAHGLMQFSEMKLGSTFLQGTKHPVSILGRSATPEMIIDHVVSLVMQLNERD